jgi:hypothetical protein
MAGSDAQARARFEDGVLRRTSAALPEDAVLLSSPPAGLPRSSAVLEELIAPFTEHLKQGTPLIVYRLIANAGMLAWNAMEATGGDVAKALAIVQHGGIDKPAAMPALLDSVRTLCERKLRLFPDDHRIFLNADVTRLPSGGVHLVAMVQFPAHMVEGSAP